MLNWNSLNSAFYPSYNLRNSSKNSFQRETNLKIKRHKWSKLSLHKCKWNFWRLWTQTTLWILFKHKTRMSYIFREQLKFRQPDYTWQGEFILTLPKLTFPVFNVSYFQFWLSSLFCISIFLVKLSNICSKFLFSFISSNFNRSVKCLSKVNWGNLL